MAGTPVCCNCGEAISVAAAYSCSTQLQYSKLPTALPLLSRKISSRVRRGSGFRHSTSGNRHVHVRVAADYSDSKPESSNGHEKWGYHPLEDLSKFEKEEMEHAGEGKLTTAEVARTVSEVNWNAFILCTVVTGKDAIFGTEVQYLVDDHGDLYFEIENDNEFLQSLSSSDIYTVLVGFDSIEGVQFSEVIEAELEEEQSQSESEESSDDSNNADIEIYWDRLEDEEDLDDSLYESFGSLGGWAYHESLDQVHPMDFALRVAESVSADHISEIDRPAKRLTITGVARPVTSEEQPYVQGIWYDRFLPTRGDGMDKYSEVDSRPVSHGNPKSVPRNEKNSEKSRPKLSDGHSGAASDAHPTGAENGTAPSSISSGGRHDRDSMSDSPSRSGNIGQESEPEADVHRQDIDSHDGSISSRDVGAKRKHRNKKRGSYLDGSDGGDDGLEVEEEPEVNIPPGATLDGDKGIGEWTEQPQSLQERSSFYKLEIVSIQLDSGQGMQTPVEVRDFVYAEPDALAHFSSAIMERVNSNGKKAENALKALCQRAKGLDVEEVSLVGVDCLGLDLRVRCGIEVQTVRIPFRRRATCKETANKLIDQLLFPRTGQRRPRKRGQEFNSH